MEQVRMATKLDVEVVLVLPGEVRAGVGAIMIVRGVVVSREKSLGGCVSTSWFGHAIVVRYS